MKTPTSQPLSLPVRLTRSLRTPFWKKTVSSILLAQFALWSVQVKGATYDWDPSITGGVTLGGAGSWNTVNTHWWNGSSNIAWPILTDTARFGGASGGLVTLGSAITAGGLTFNTTGYNIAGGGNSLTLTPASGFNSPIIAVNNNGLGTNQATISSSLTGTSGFSKTGNGTLRLSADNSSTLSGDIAIKGGNVIISNQNQLGSTIGTAISVTGVAGTGNPGFSGGALVLQGSDSGAGSNLAGTVTLDRELTIAGRGPGAANATGSFVSIGYNTLAGGLTLASAIGEARAWATHGNTTASGSVNLGTGGGQIFYGNGNWNISGQLSGVDTSGDRLTKSGNIVASTMWLQNGSNNFASPIRIDSGTVRVAVNSALGINTGTGQVDLNNGTLEVRTDAAAGFAGRTVRLRNNVTGTIFVDHDLSGPLSLGSGSLQNQTVTFGGLIRDAGANNTNFNYAGRNGYNISFTSALPSVGDHRSWTTNNNTNGTLTYAGDIWNTNAITAGTITIQGGAETIITGRILATGTATERHAFTKAGSGMLTLEAGSGSLSTFTNNANVNDGTLAIRSISSLNPTSASAGRVVFGGGALSFLGASSTGAGETWTNKILDMNNANSYVLANQSGSAPSALVLPNNFGVTNTGAKTLHLGGSAPSSVVNQVTGLITNGVNLTNINKFGTGTWEIAAPTNYGTASSVNLAATGTTATAVVTLSSGSTATLQVGQPISGAGIPAGATIAQVLNGTTLILSANRAASTAAAAASVGVASGVTGALAVSANAANVLTVASTANLVPGQAITGPGMSAAAGWFVSQITSGTTITVANSTGAAALANSAAIGSQTLASSPNFGGNLTITSGTFRANAASATSDIINSTSNLIFNTDSVTLMGNAGGTFNYVGFAGGTSTEVLGRLVPTAGHGTVSMTNGTGADTLIFLDIGARGAGATLNYQPGTGTINFSGTAPVGTNGIQSGYATFNGVDWVNSGATASQFTGYTAGAGALTLAAATNFSVAGAASTAGAGSINSLKLTGGAVVTLGGQLSFTTNPGGVLFDNSSGTASITGSILGTAAQELVVTTNGSSPAVAPSAGAALTTGDALTIGSTISSGAGALTKAGTGALILTGANAYTGNTIINQGAIQMSGATAALGSLATAGNQTAIRQGGILDVNAAGVSTALYAAGPNFTQINIGALTGTGLITNSGDGSTTPSSISLGGAASTGQTTFGGTLQDGTGILNVIITGTGTRSQAIVGAQPYTGATVINNANLAVTSLADGNIASGLGASSNAAANLIFNGGSLTYTGASAAGATSGGGIYQITQTPSVSTNRLFTLAGNATIQSSGTYGNEAASNGTGANHASLIWSNTGDIEFVNTGTRTLTLGGSSIGDNEMRIRLRDNPNATEALSLTKADGGLWILNPLSSNAYTGTTTVSGGALRVANDAASVQGLSATSPLVLNGGVLETATSFTRTLGTAVAGTGNVSLIGGASGFSASTTDRLVVTLGGGNLTWGAAATTFGPTSLVLGSSTALGETEITNNINLNGTSRVVTVNNNSNTGTMVTAGILSGTISNSTGTAGFTKNGGGPLILGNANTYNGNTQVDNGNVIVTSIGTGSSSSLGSAGTFISNQGNADFNPIIYVGSGETAANRNLTLQASANFSDNRNIRIEASGSNALVWNTGTFAHTTRGDTVARNLILDLRGSNTDNNQMNLVLTNSTNATFGNVLNVSKGDGGTWVLNPASANTFTGTITAAGGNLGLTANGIGAASQINISNGAIFAYGGALTTSKLIQLNNNATAVFAGQNAITLNGNVQKQAGNNAQTISNNLEGGALLTVNGNFVNLETANNQTINIRGFGSTAWNGVIANSSGSGTTSWNVAIANDASFTFGGASANTYTGITTLSQGTLVLNKTLGVAQIGTGSQFNFGGGVLRSDAGLLTGVNALPNNLFLTGNPATFTGPNNIELTGNLTTNAGNRILINNLTTLTHSGSNFINLSNDGTPRVLTIAGSGATILNSVVQGAAATPAQAGTLAYSGTGSLLLTRANTTAGSLTVNRGTATISGAGSWAGTVNINSTGTLALDNTAGSVNRLADAQAVVGNGGTLNFIGNTAGSSETAGQLNLTNTQSTITMNVTGGTNILTFASLATPNTGSSLDLSTISNLGASGAGGNQVIFTAAPALTNGINTRILINAGADFATHGATGVTAFTGYNVGNNLNTALATDTMNLTASAATTANRTVNAIKINGTGLSVSGAPSNRLTLTSGGVLNTGGNNSLDVAETAFGAAVGYFQVAPTTTLTVNGDLTSSGGFAKLLSGNLTFGAGARSFITSTHNLMGGTVTLNGGADTFFPNQAFNLPAGGTLNLNGGGQYVNALNSQSGLPNAGGIVNGAGALVVGSGGGTFGGVISSGTALARVGGGTLTFETAQSYTGPTLLLAGTTTLENDATILNTSSLDINYATLSLSNNSGLQTQNNDRIADALAISLRGGTISVTGRVDTTAVESLGAVSALQGANTITATAGGGTFNSMDLTLASLTRSNGATVNFTGSTLGQQGNSARIMITSPLTGVGSGLLGAWAIANSTDYAAYNTGLGIGVVGQGGFTGYDGTFATGNLTQIPATAATTTNLTAGTTNTGVLRLAGAFTNDITFSAGTNVLNLELGGLLRSNENFASSIGTVASRGILTSGTSELVVYNNGNASGATAMTINSNIQGAGTALVKSGGGVLALTGVNTYGGGTTVAQGTLELRGTTTGDVVIPAGGLTLNNANVTQFVTAVTNPTGQGQIDPTNSVTLRGGSVLTMTGNNTLAGIGFDNNGGTATPTVTSGGILTLTNANPITVTSTNVASVATIAGTLSIPTGAQTINTPAIQVNGITVSNLTPTLAISANIISPGTSITKTGNGLLQLSGQNLFNGLTVSGGGVVVGASSSPAQGGAGLTSGPLGAGSVSMAAGTTLFSNTTAAIGNAVSFAGTPTFDTTDNTARTLTLNGAISGAGWTGTPTVEVSNPGLTVALLGNLPAFSSITKTGLGTLIFNSTNYSGDYDATALGNPLAISLLHDGTSPNIGSGAVETLALPGNVIFNTVGTGTITVNRGGGGLPFNLAANKIISAASINTVLTNGLTVANTNGYGLSVLDSGALVGTPTYTVNTATASNVTQGLYMSGTLSGTGFIKAGGGTLVLDNASNTFLGDITINQGVVSAAGNAQLGTAANIIKLAATAGTATLRATGTYTLANPLQLTGATNNRAIEVTSGNTLTINNAFDLNAGAGAAATLLKADQGTLALTVANSGWSGAFTINGGVVSTSLPAALGTGTLVVNETGAALQLSGGIAVANPITIDVVANGRNNTGINTGGALQSVSGSNTFSSAITINATTATDNQSRNFGFGANNGATLNLGNINMNHPSGGTNRNVIGYFNTPGTGAINVSGIIDNASLTPGGNTFLFKLGDGTMTLSAANAIPKTEVRVYRGGLVLNSAATFGSSTVNAQVQAWQNGSITFDNSVTNTANRLTNRVVQIGGGTLNFIPNAAGTSQVSTGALQISQGANVFNMAAGGNQTVTFASLTQNGGATMNMTGTFGTANNKVTFATAPTLSPATASGLLARITTNGNEFATYSATTGISTFTAYAPATNVLSAGATQTYLAKSATANSLTGNQTLNALTLQSGPLVGNVPNVGGLLGLNPTTLTLTSGAILANGTGAGTNSSLSVPVVALGGAEGIIHVASGQTLNVSSGFSGTAGLTKSLNGTLNLNQQQYVSGNTIVNGGTLNLQSGATNTLLFNNGLGINTGATVDLKNGVQFIGSLFSANGGGNTDLSGGTLTNTGAQATLVTNSNSNFNGQITGTIYLNKTGTNNLNLQSANTFSGDTFITGGTLNLQDDGTILNTSAIAINYGSLNMSNGALRDNTNRVSDTAPITMIGGTLNFGGRAQMNSSEVLGAVTLVAGNNSIFADDGNVGVGTGTLTLASLTRAGGSTATLRFNNLADFGAIGSRGRVMVTSAPTLTNNIVGPWAIVDREFASYDSTYGIGGLNQTGFAGYAGSGLNSSPLATDNVRFSTTGTTTLLANTTLGTLNFASQNVATILNLGGNTLTIQGGGLLFGQASDSIDFSITNGNITSGVINTPSDFYLTQANYGGTNRTVTIGASITDNGTGAVRLIKSGGENNGVTTLSGLNTYTGGTVVNSGTLTLGATGTLGSGGITVNQATLTQVAGGVIPSQVLTMNGSSTVTLVGNNTLSGLTIDNNGGSAPTLTPTGILTLTGGTTVTSSNAGAVATLGTGTIDLNGATAYSINVGATLVNSQDVAPWQAGLIINSTIQNGGITKTGAGVLQLGGANTFTSGVTISSGGLIIASDTNSLLLNDPVVTGPVGTGLLTMGANTTMIAGGAARTITNNVTFLGDTVFNGTNNLTLNGTTTLPAIWGATVTAPQMTVTIGDASPSLSSDVINKSGLGLLVVGNYAGTINASGGLLFSADGNTLGTSESINLTGNVNITGDTAITVNRSGGAPNARNKTLQKVDLVNGGSIMSVSNLSGYGLEFTGTTTLNGASHFAVGTATASNVVQGLILSGVVSDAGGYDLVKSGPGTLVLGNSGNTFGAAGKTIDILGGILSVSSDGALGNSNNSITLNADAGTGVGFRSTGTFSTTRLFNLNQANNAVEVTSGNLLTLSSPLAFSATTNALFKNDNGILEITAANSTWNSTITVAGGALQISNSAAVGTSTLATSGAGQTAIYLSGDVNIANALNLTTVAGGATGINSTGALFSLSGANTYSGLITQPSGVGAFYGAANGATLNINGNIAASNSPSFNAIGNGIINLNSVYGNGGTGGPSFIKIGTGTLNVTVNQPAVTSAVSVNQGTMNVSGSGVTLGITGTITVGSAATLNVSDATGAASSHLGNRPLTITGGTFTYTGNAANSAETNTSALTMNRGGSIYTSNQTGSGTVSLTFASLGLGADTSGNFTGTNLGTATNKLLFTTAPTLTNNILQRATVNGSTFATYGANGIAGFTAYNATSATNINSAGANDTVDANAAMTTKSLTASKTINALRLSGATGQTVGGAAFNTLTLASGGVLATGAATHNISVPVLTTTVTTNNSAQQIYLVDTGSTLNLSSVLTGNAGLVKDGDGTLVLASPANVAGLAGVNSNTLSNTVNISRGTLRLNGGTNTMLPGVAVVLGGPAATLDLNGTSQVVGAFLTDSSTPNTGGSIIGGAGSQLVINLSATDRSFAGSIGNSVNLVRSGPNTLTFYSPNTTTGVAIINGGTTSLQSDGNLSGITALDINFATLSADNNTGLSDNANRINDAAPITLRGGTLTVQGRAQAASSETLGSVSAVQGFNVINPLVGGTGVNSIDVSLASLSRSVGSAATLIVQGTNLGTIGSNSRVTVGTLNGVTTTNPTYSANGSGLTNNLVGGWAINGSDFLSYIPGLGFAPLNQAGAAQYDLTNTFVGGVSTDNVRLTATTSVPNGGSLVNAVSMSGSNIALNFATGTDTLNIVSGGLIGPNNNQTIGAIVDSGRITAGGLTPTANSDLYVFNRANTLTINSRITDNANGGTSSVRAVFTPSGGAITLPNINNSYTGGTVVNGGTLNLLASATGITIPLASTPANGLILNGATVTMGSSTNTFSGQIAAGNIVTLNGVSTLNLFGNNTLEGLVFNNIGGGSGNNQVNTFSTATAAGTGSTGILSIGNSGITVTSSNIASTALILGLANFGATAKTINVAPINVNGVDVAPLQAAFALYGITGTTGGITKTGNGVLQFNAQAQYTGPTTVNAGGIRTGVTFGGSRYSALTLNSGTYLNLNGATTTWGSLSGSGAVLNSSATNATLNVGYDNTSTTFSGQFQRFNDAALAGVAIQKIGTGTLNLTSAQSFATGTTGTITVNGGGLTYSGAGAAFPATTVSGGATITVNNGGTLTLSNVDSNVNNRLGMNLAGTFNIQGGILALAGNSGANTTETITTFNITTGGGRVELTPNAATSTGLTITTLSGANGNGSLVVGGIDGSAAGTVNKATLTITTPALIGGQGTGVNGTTTMAVRHDILGDASVSGLGTGFLVRDSVGLTYRALASSELASAIALPLVTDADPVTAGNQAAGLLNVGLVGATQSLSVNSVANTLTFSGTNTINSGLGATFGNYGPGGGLLTLSLSQAAASLTLAGATANVSVGAFGSTAAGTTPFVHVIAGGTLNVNGAFAVNGTAGLAKADGGVMNLNNKAYYTGTTTINNGTLNLNSGAANTIAVVPTAGTATVSRLDLNGTSATLDLKGQNQAVGQIVSVNPLPGLGGTITNSGALALFTNSSQAGSSTFGGRITGAIAFNRIGNNTTTLTNANTYTGATTVRGGTLQLRDSGSISSTAGLTLNYGTLNWDNFGLNPNGTPNPTRVAAANPVTLQGGSLTINGAGSTDTVVTLNSVTVTGGQNAISTLPYINQGSTVKLTIGNLERNASNRSGVNFNGFSTNNSTGSNTLGGQGLNTNSNIMLTQVNGANFNSSNLVNNLIGGWAVADGSTFATYGNTYGVVAMGNTYGGFSAPVFTGTDITSTVVTGNYNDAGTGTTAITRTMTTGAKTANSWRIAQSGAATTVTPVAGTTYSFGVGIITNNNQTVTIGAVDTSNTLTGTGADLYMFINSGTTIIQPSIIGSAALVSNGPSTLRLAPAFASNTYSGGTFINNGTTNLQAATGLVAIPGALTINNATVTLGNATANQIATTSAVTINGGGQLNLFSYTGATSQTLDSLTFNNEGGSAAPTFAFSNPTALSTITLSNANAITATNNNLALTPIIAAATTAANSALTFSNANPVITVNAGLAETGLNITAPITGIGGFTTLTKSGVGALALSGASTFTTGFILNQGSLIFGAGSTGAPVTSGPVGTGSLTIAGGTAVLSDGTARNIGNAVTVNGDFTFGGVIAGNNLTLSGAVNLGAAGRTITVTSPAVTSTISGAITSTATGTALTKVGAGTLILSSASNNFAGAAVAVTGGILKNGVNNAVPAASPVTVSAGAGYDLNGFDQTTDTLTGLGFVTNSANSAKTLTLGGALTNITSTLDTTLTDNVLAQASSRLNLTKVGTGTLTIPTANNHSGVTTVSGGMISITNAAALGTVTGGTVVSSGASLELSNNITVTGEALSITGTGSASNGALRNLSGNNTFAGAVTLTDAASIQSDAGSLTLDVPSGNAITATNRNLTFTGAGNTTVADAIAIGSGSLTKTGSGSLTLAATNTYSGKTTIANGTISVGSTAALGTNAALDLGVATTSSGRLLYTGGVTTLTKDINALGNGTDTIQNAGSGLLTLSGTLTKAGTTLNLVGGASGILVTGTIVGLPASSDLVIGNGTTTLQNANTYNGPTILNSGGTLNINHASAISTGAFTINGGTLDNTSGAAITLSTSNPLNINANFTFTGTNSLNLGNGPVTLDANRTVTVMANTLTIGGPIGGAFSLTGTGAGTLVLSGASTYTGTTTAVAGSTISVGGNGSLGDTSSGTVIDSGASLALNNVLYTDAEPLNINGAGVGSGGAFITTGTSSFAGTITATTNATINATGTLSLTGGLVKNGTTLTLGGTGTYNISGAGISGSSANSDLVVDASTVNLDVASTYNGPTFIRNGGRINANVASALPTSTARTAIIMDDSGSGSSTLGLAVNQSVASLTGASSSQILLAANQLTVGASGSGSSTFAGSIAGTGGSIVKDGTNTQTFSGANTFTGTTTLNAGTLNLGSAENAGVSGPLGIGGSIVFGGGTLQYSVSNQNDYSGRFSTAAGQAISIDTNSQNVTLATALISSGGSLNKQGAGTLTVTGANTFDAGTTVNGGTLMVNNTTGSGTGSGAVSVSNAGTVLGGNGTIAGNLSVNAGALLAPGSAASTAGTLTIGGSTVVIAGNGVAETRVNFDYTNATGNVPGLTPVTWSSYSGSLLTGNGGQDNDLLNFTATTTSLTWNTGGKISLNQIGSAYSWIQGDVFNLLDWTALGDSGNGPGSIGGSFNSAIDFNLPTLSGGLAWDTSRFVTTGAIAVIPEPSRALLMLFGLMALFFRRRRQD